MRKAALAFLSFVACSLAADAQRFSILPQVGFENSKTSISYNDLASTSPLGVKFTPHGSLRLVYSSKPGHGFFAGVASSRSTTLFSFTDPENGMNNYMATTGNMQLRLEGGYLFNSRPIYFNKAASAAASRKKDNTKEKKDCAAPSRSYCNKNYSLADRCRSKSSQPLTAKSKNRGAWMRIQPSAGVGFIPSVKSDVITKTQNAQTTYQYRAGNWNTAFIAGSGFEFGKGKTRLFTISINYFKGIGNLSTQTLTTSTLTKSVTTTLQSAVQGWNVQAGIPFTLGSGKSAKQVRSKTQRPECQPYRIQYRCRSI